MRALLSGTLAASLVLPLLAMLAGLIWGEAQTGMFLALAVAIVVVPHVLLLGLPIFLLLRRLHRVGAGTMAGAGFLAGMLPLGLYSWPYWTRYPGHSATRDWHGRQVSLVEDGMPTAYAVLVHLEGVAVLGLLGALCALVFWGVWRGLQRRSAADAYIFTAPAHNDDESSALPTA